MSWKRALDIIDARAGLRSAVDVEGGSLRHWRRVIGKAHVDFQVGFLGHGPSLIISLAMGVDGRTENSSFPNLVLHKQLGHYLMQE